MAIKSLRDLLVGAGPISQFEQFGKRPEARSTGLSTTGFTPSSGEAATMPTNVFENEATGMAPNAVMSTGAPLGTFNFGNPFDNEGGRDRDTEFDNPSEDESEGGGDSGSEGEGGEGEGDDDF